MVAVGTAPEALVRLEIIQGEVLPSSRSPLLRPAPRDHHRRRSASYPPRPFKNARTYHPTAFLLSLYPRCFKRFSKACRPLRAVRSNVDSSTPTSSGFHDLVSLTVISGFRPDGFQKNGRRRWPRRWALFGGTITPVREDTKRLVLAISLVLTPTVTLKSDWAGLEGHDHFFQAGIAGPPLPGPLMVHSTCLTPALTAAKGIRHGKAPRSS